jgi:hypothetical protein
MMEDLPTRKLMTRDISSEQIEALLYNILPGGETIIHRLKSRPFALEQLYNAAQPDQDKRNVIKFHIPFLPDCNGNSPM